MQFMIVASANPRRRPVADFGEKIEILRDPRGACPTTVTRKWANMAQFSVRYDGVAGVIASYPRNACLEGRPSGILLASAPRQPRDPIGDIVATLRTNRFSVMIVAWNFAG
jgi:hypothetical protein